MTFFKRADPAAFYSQQLSLQPPDCCAVVEGVSLPLHSSPLAAHCEVLQDLFSAFNNDELASGSAGLDLSPMFKDASLQEVACLLWFIYRPRNEACPANLAVLAAAGLLPGVARLAHCLYCRLVLSAIDDFLKGTMQRQRVAELILAAQLSQVCNSALKEDVLNLLARKLVSAAHVAALLPQQVTLAALDSATLAHLLRRTLREVALRRLQGGVSFVKEINPTFHNTN